MNDSRDSLYAHPRSAIEKFAFDDRVVAVFPDMIRRSVPGYATVVGMLGVIAERHVVSGSNVYDLGCSLGAATAAMRASVARTDCRFVAVDNAPAMVARAAEFLYAMPGAPVQVSCEDIRETVFDNASMTVMNYTLQFVPLGSRLSLLKKIRMSMKLIV